MLKYQVQTLNRERRPRKSMVHLNQLFPGGDETSGWLSGNCTDAPSSPGPSSSSSGSSASSGRRLRRLRSTSISSLSSASTTSEEWGTIRVYTGAVHADSDYKTLYVPASTNAEQIVHELFSKFRSRFRDPNLFYLTMEIFTRHEGNLVTSRLPLDPKSKPLELQSFHPKDKCRFVLSLRRGAPIKIYDQCLNVDSVYKSILVSELTSCRDAIQLLLQMHRLTFDPAMFRLVAVDVASGGEQPLADDLPLLSIVQQLWWDENCQFQLRPKSLRESRVSGMLTPSIGRKPSFHDSLTRLTQKLNAYYVF